MAILSQVIIVGMALAVGIGLATAFLQYLWNVTLPQISTFKVITISGRRFGCC